MADWRARGYVADSDDDDDSQASIGPTTLHAEQTVTSTLGIRCAVPLHQDAGIHDRDEGTQRQDAFKGYKEIPLDYGDKGNTNRACDPLNALEPALGNGRLLEVVKQSRGDYVSEDTTCREEIDELCQDYYQDRASPKGSEYQHEADEFASSIQPSNGLFPSASSPQSSPLSILYSPPGATTEIHVSATRTPSSQGNSPPNEIVGSQDRGTVSSAGTLLNVEYEQPSNKIARTLRRRNPIQLHPYVIESERYRQTCKARGVKPLRLVQLEAEAVARREEESQNIDFNGDDSQPLESTSDLGDAAFSSPIGTQTSITGTETIEDNVLEIGDDCLPDLNSLLSNPSQKYIGNGRKRRKIASASFRMPFGMRREVHKSSPAPMPHLTEDDDGIVYDVPLSPPSSGIQTPARTRDVSLPKERSLQKISKVAIPTPITSSEPRNPRVIEVTGDAQASDTTSNEPDSGDSATENDSSQLQQVQRKIRGVLPASWLKIDFKAQKQQPSNALNTQRSPSPESNALQRGVARPIVTRKGRASTTRQNAVPLFDSDDSDSSSANIDLLQKRVQRPMAHIEADEGNDFQGDRWGEAAEENRIDAMLSGVKKPKHPLHKIRKQQTLTAPSDSTLQAVATGSPHQLTSFSTAYERASKDFDKGHKRKSTFRPPKLSVLDSPSLDETLQDAAPSFLKIATRSVRSRKDKGKHSPSRKYLRLATKSDNQDVVETLRSWREGTIVGVQARSTKPGTVRKPLHQRSANNVPSTRTPNGKHASPSNEASHSSLMKHRPSTVGSKRTQSSLDHVIRLEPDKTYDSVENPKLHESVEYSKRRKLVSSVQGAHGVRPAMLEGARDNENEKTAPGAFRQDLSRIDQFDNESGLANVLRLFGKDTTRSYIPSNDSRDGQHSMLPKVNTNAKKQVTHRKRKGQPKHLDASAPWYKHPRISRDLVDLPDNDFPLNASHTAQKRIVTGLGSFGTSYSDDFGVTPLPTGVCFQENTLLGSGLFARSLNFDRESILDSPRGFALLNFNGKIYRWGPWNDFVSSEMTGMASEISEMIGASWIEGQRQSIAASLDSAISAFRSIIVYFSDHLSFLDPIDRHSLTQKCKNLLPKTLVESYGDPNSAPIPQQSSLVCFVTLQLIFAYQIYQLSQHELVPPPLRDEAWSLVQKFAKQILTQVMTKGFEEFETCAMRCHRPDAANHLLGDEHTSIEAFIVARHILLQDPTRLADFWKSIPNSLSAQSPENGFDVGISERSWKRLFTLLPFLELDQYGVLETGRRFREMLDNWSLIKQLVDPVLEASANSRGLRPNFNVYCRTLFRRSLHLINDWGWRRCENIIGTLFDHFARNKMAHLRNEECHGSPLFLEQLGSITSLESGPDDRCFHLLLKIIGSGLKHMRSIYTEKRLRNLIWRLLPNHGRAYPKEEAIHQVHLDALRNHHDLLCMLYWASPAGSRPSMTMIRNLIHPESSHREACHIHVRAWFNLVRFQLSTDEPVTSLYAFREWLDDLLAQIVRQHTLARTEVEDQIGLLQRIENIVLSRERLESTISKNQRQVEAVLSDALISLKLAVDIAQNERTAAAIIPTTLTKVFNLFDSKTPQSSKVVTQALDVLLALTVQCMQQQKSSSSRNNDDSQDYGDWPDFEDDGPEISSTKDAMRLPLQDFQEPLRYLLWNAFGSDAAPDDAFLQKLVYVWIDVAQALVRSGEKSWNDYLDQFGNDSWSSLRDTEQTRKYTAYFLATMIKKDEKVLSDHEDLLLKSWMGSLVERESVLKFQHQLTKALLNSELDCPILKNLPFWRNPVTGSFEISAADFSERRIALISSVLSDMRVSIEEASLNQHNNLVRLRQEYRDMLKYLMATMKRNYQELGHSSNVRGAYVDFVHKVVELLQQHTSNICPIDRFFTDSGTFPLPATDPTYVVGQLKNYALRLQDKKTPKQLVVFLQSVSERAAIDGQQPYLINQLRSAMSMSFEDSKSERPTLRSFLIKAVIPAYVEVGFTKSSCGWILALPYVQALQPVFQELPNDLDGVNPDSVTAVACIIIAFLGSVRQSLGHFKSTSDVLEEPGLLKLLSACFSAMTSLVPILDYVTRLGGPTESAVRNVQFFNEFATYILARLEGWESDFDLENEVFPKTLWSDTRDFALQELRGSLAKNWTYVRQEEQYCFTRGNFRKEIVVDTGLYEEEKAAISKILAEFLACVQSMPSLHDDDGQMSRKQRLGDSSQLMIL